MDDNNKNNQGSSDENEIAELEHELEELERQKREGESVQKVVGDNQSKAGNKIDGGFEKPASDTFPEMPPVVAAKPDGKEAPRVQEDDTKSSAIKSSSNRHSTIDRKSNLLYYIGIALMVFSLALLAFSFFLGR